MHTLESTCNRAHGEQDTILPHSFKVFGGREGWCSRNGPVARNFTNSAEKRGHDRTAPQRESKVLGLTRTRMSHAAAFVPDKTVLAEFPH